MLELVKAFDKRATFATLYEDINTIYKEGIEIVVENGNGDGLSKIMCDLTLDTPESQQSEQNRFILKGPFVYYIHKVV